MLAVFPGKHAGAPLAQRFFESHGPRTGLVALPITDALPQTTIHLFCRTDAPLTLPTQRLKDGFEQEAKALRRERKAA